MTDTTGEAVSNPPTARLLRHVYPLYEIVLQVALSPAQAGEDLTVEAARSLVRQITGEEVTDADA